MLLQVIRRAEEVWREDEGLAAIRDRTDFVAGDFFDAGVKLCSMPPLCSHFLFPCSYEVEIHTTAQMPSCCQSAMAWLHLEWQIAWLP